VDGICYPDAAEQLAVAQHNESHARRAGDMVAVRRLRELIERLTKINRAMRRRSN
jgi:hypothetical protein